MMGTATFVKRMDGSGEGRLFKLDPPIDLVTQELSEPVMTDHLWVSQVEESDNEGIMALIYGPTAPANTSAWAVKGEMADIDDINDEETAKPLFLSLDNVAELDGEADIDKLLGNLGYAVQYPALDEVEGVVV